MLSTGWKRALVASCAEDGATTSVPSGSVTTYVTRGQCDNVAPMWDAERASKTAATPQPAAPIRPTRPRPSN
eukprot:10878763-Lingulodinium_polyedra.AAC.1